VPYVAHLEQLAAQRPTTQHVDFAPHLDGEAGRRLRDAVAIDDLRTIGAFFTGEVLAKRLVELVPRDRRRYVDAACGCGDLLLAASARLDVEPSLERTLAAWNRRLIGRDLIPEFVRATRARIVLAARARGAQSNGGRANPGRLLTNIAVGDGRLLRAEANDAVLLNPPYGRVAAPTDCAWTSGMTTEAALFTDHVLERSAPGAHLAAILPEVLRAGTRYDRFRAEVDRRLTVRSVVPVGVFDALTDVDVFMLTGDVRAAPAEDATTTWVPRTQGPRLDDICTVSVGALVAYREPMLGEMRAYLHARNRGAASEIVPVEERPFRGRVAKPPFVVIGRTNAPARGGGPRLRATIVRGKRPVAVENHLLVLDPYDKTVRGCRVLVEIVEARRATEFLDARLRCRHLTVRAVGEIPR
jgi:hypothetical protein